MQEHVHPISGLQIAGMQLVAGAELRSTDVYDSTTGKWEECPPGVGKDMTYGYGDYYSGLILREGHAAVWVRPGELSTKTQELLVNLARSLLDIHEPSMTATRLPIGRWAQYPIDRQCVADLRDCGLVAPHKGTTYESMFTTVLRLTPLGKEIAAQLEN